MRSRRALVALACAATGLLAGTVSATARAEVIPTVCTAGVGDVKSLTEAVEKANEGAGADTIVLGTGCSYTLAAAKAKDAWYGPNGLPPIASPVTIEGNGATIARAAEAPPFRLFFVGADPAPGPTEGYASPGAGSLTLRDVILSGGLAAGGDSNGGGGGAGLGGAIFNLGTVAIEGSTITGNRAQGGSAGNAGAGRGGGGIGQKAPPSGAGGGFGVGGALGSGGKGGKPGAEGGGGGAGLATTENGGDGGPTAGGVGGGEATGTGGSGSGLEAGRGGDGSGGGGGKTGIEPAGLGGDFGAGGAAGAGGGGVGGGGGANGTEPALGTASAGGGGFGGGGGAGAATGAGGVGGFGGGGGGGGAGEAKAGFGGGAGAAAGGGGAGMGGAVFNMQGSLSISRSTLIGNSAVGGASALHAGQGIAGAVLNLNGTFTSTGSTFAANEAADRASQIYNLVYDAHTARTALATLKDTIVSGGVGGGFNLVSAKLGEASAEITPGPDLGTATANLSELDLVRSFAKQEKGQVSGSPLTSDPLLGPLQNNGGATPTMALLAGSPAIDAGAAFGLAVDQRGLPRPVNFSGLPDNGGDGSDIGAFEVQPLCAGAALPYTPCTPPEPEKKVEVPPPPPPTTKPPEPPSTNTPRSPGTLSAVATQKLGPTVAASFLCKASRCVVTVTARLSFGKKHITLGPVKRTLKEGQRVRFVLAIPKKTRPILAKLLAKHARVIAGISAVVTYSEGKAKAGPLIIRLVR